MVNKILECLVTIFILLNFLITPAIIFWAGFKFMVDVNGVGFPYWMVQLGWLLFILIIFIYQEIIQRRYEK